jgi:hypothetical protein
VKNEQERDHQPPPFSRSEKDEEVRELPFPALMQASTVDCLGHTITDDGSSVGNFENIVPVLLCTLNELLIGSKCPFLSLSLSLSTLEQSFLTLEQFGCGKGVMGA